MYTGMNSGVHWYEQWCTLVWTVVYTGMDSFQWTRSVLGSEIGLIKKRKSGV